MQNPKSYDEQMQKMSDLLEAKLRPIENRIKNIEEMVKNVKDILTEGSYGFSHVDQMTKIQALLDADIERLESLPKEEAKIFARQELEKTGILDENGNFTEPYARLGEKLCHNNIRLSFDQQADLLCKVMNRDIDRIKSLPADEARKEAHKTLMVAGIVDEQGRVTEPYAELFKNNSGTNNLDTLRDKLRVVKDWYWEFEVAVINYAKKNPERMTNVLIFMISKPEATTSDILEFISNQPDFYEDAAYGEEKYHWKGKIRHDDKEG